MQNIFVVKILTNNLLGLPAVRALKVLKQVENVQLEPIIQLYHALLRGFETFKTEYKIRLKTIAVLFAIYTPRPVALP